MPAFGRKSDCQVIREFLPEHHDGKFGYVVYRCVYGNDEQWASFLQRLKQYATAALEQAKDGHEVVDDLTWDVEEDDTGLDGASKVEVRRRFRAWSTSRNGKITLTRYTKCIHADAEVVASVLQGEDPSSTAPGDTLRPRAFVNVINSQYRDVITPRDPEDFPDADALRRHDEGDEGFEPIEGCRRHDVGWMKVPARRLVPFAYQKLMKNGWHVSYVRPPGMFDD